MKNTRELQVENIEGHYTTGQILEDIRTGLERQGKELAGLSPTDLAPIDEFHIRGRESTLELARRASLGAGDRVLDLGCGLGGSARFLASEEGCDVLGVDLTAEYVSVATALAGWVGLQDRVRFQQASALDLPFAEASFDVVWTEHVQMNIEDKQRFYREARRILRPGGKLVFHDVFHGEGPVPLFPVPWAEAESQSFLWSAERVRETLESLGFRVEQWECVSKASSEWFQKAVARLSEGGPPPLGIHLLMKNTAPEKLRNLARNLEADSVRVLQAVVTKSLA